MKIIAGDQADTFRSAYQHARTLQPLERVVQQRLLPGYIGCECPRAFCRIAQRAHLLHRLFQRLYGRLHIELFALRRVLGVGGNEYALRAPDGNVFVGAQFRALSSLPAVAVDHVPKIQLTGLERRGQMDVLMAFPVLHAHLVLRGGTDTVAGVVQVVDQIRMQAVVHRPDNHGSIRIPVGVNDRHLRAVNQRKVMTVVATAVRLRKPHGPARATRTPRIEVERQPDHIPAFLRQIGSPVVPGRCDACRQDAIDDRSRGRNDRRTPDPVGRDRRKRIRIRLLAATTG
ncbi:hypothetical protein R70006_04302 [Paraburkholderia domus]|nr:hypothetical protein R70006_04302 [Paraburkholderia domus]